jgi:hypothetical protein
MRVSREVKSAFDYVVGYMNLDEVAIAECKAEFEADPAWGAEFYLRSERLIRATQGLTQTWR